MLYMGLGIVCYCVPVLVYMLDRGMGGKRSASSQQDGVGNLLTHSYNFSSYLTVAHIKT